MTLSISRVAFEHYRAALGIAEATPRISWRFAGNVSDWEQSSYNIEINRGKNASASNIFTGSSADSLYVPWPDTPLREAESARVRVRAHGSNISSSWSEWVSVETGLAESSWSDVVTITKSENYTGDIDLPKRPIYFRKEFNLPSSVASARLYITALGVYEAMINGKTVGDQVLSPGWPSFQHRQVYDTYDITSHLKSGNNTIGIIVGEGWYTGRLGFGGGERNIYGTEIGLLSVLVATLNNGTQIRVPTDDSWKSGTGPIILSEIYNGEHYDQRLEASVANWTTTEFDDAKWSGARALPKPVGALVPADQPPVRRTQEVAPQKVWKSPSGQPVIDFGQNLVGWLKVKVNGTVNSPIYLQHVEVLMKEEINWEPKFTFHGFRYAILSNWPADVPLDAEHITAVVVHTDMEQTGWFESSNELLNKFHSNVRWSMKGNFVSIPTDCPQRDERLGWSGDAHAFGNTANFLFDTAGFWRAWHKDIWSDMQQWNMVVPAYVPRLPGKRAPRPTAVWGDVVVGNPWNMYQAFGDLGLLDEHLPQAKDWIDVGLARGENGLWNRSTFQYGDWLDPKSPSDAPGKATTHTHLVADAYLVRMTEILSDIHAALGRQVEADKYAADRLRLRDEFLRQWTNVSSSGDLANRTQTAYALGIAFDLFKTEADKISAVTTLREVIKENKYLVGTGFAGTPALGEALRQVNATDDFYRMLLATEVPSWLYSVVMNGTTTWERWDSLLPDGRLNPGEMTSYNHYAFGAVADWMHKVIGGLSPAAPGWKRITVAPVPGPGITSGHAKFLSPYGEVECQWSVTPETGFKVRVRVPPNTKADIILPGRAPFVVGSGNYEF